MSILIKGMEMPKNCDECPFATPTRDGLMCDAVSFLAKCLVHPVSRMSCCPLIELPPHGDLIDRDSVLEILSDKNAAWDGYIKVKALPIVVESEKK